MLRAGKVVLRTAKPLNEVGEKDGATRYTISDGKKTVEINDQGSAVVTIPVDELERSELRAEDIKPSYVARVVDRAEFGKKMSRAPSGFVSHSGEYVYIAAPLAAHSETAQTMVGEFIAAAAEQLNQAAEAAQYAQANG